MVKSSSDDIKKDSGIIELIQGMGNYFNIFLIAATFFINYGMFHSDYLQMTKRVDDIEALKPEQIKWMSEQHEKRISVIEGEQKALRDTVFEMKTKIDVIAEWVKDQKDVAGHGH